MRRRTDGAGRIPRGGAGARTVALVAAGALGAGMLAGCGGQSGADTDGARGETGAPRLAVSGAFMPKPVTTGMAAGFLTVTNTGGADTLTSVTSDIAARVTMHSTQGETMRHQDSFPVPAHGRLVFARGADHLMFEQLTHQPETGDTVAVELHFKRSGTVDVKVPVKPATYNPTRPSDADPTGPSSAASS